MKAFWIGVSILAFEMIASVMWLALDSHADNYILTMAVFFLTAMVAACTSIIVDAIKKKT